eukprot:scaffold34049_cov71-Cyclotella_meneghiniana.AAC.4
MTEQRKAVIKNADMTEEMQQDAVDIASQALAKYNIEKDVAAYIKKEFDKKHNPTWWQSCCLNQDKNDEVKVVAMLMSNAENVQCMVG